MFKKELKSLIGGFGELKSKDSKRCGLHYTKISKLSLMQALRGTLT